MNDESLPLDELLRRCRNGDEAAATAIFNLFVRRLIGLAHTQIDTQLRRKVDAEDVVISVFKSFFVRHRDGQFELGDGDNLWSLLARITVCKCTNVRVALGRQARNARLEVSIDRQSNDSAPSWEALAREPTPAEAAAFNEIVKNLLSELPERERRIVLLNLEGKDVPDISKEINRAERTVRRTLKDFRDRLEQAILDPSTLF